MLKRVLLVAIALFVLFACGCADKELTITEAPVNKSEAVNYVDIKYRDTPVNLASANFEYLDTDKSSFIRGAWYDKRNEYMVIKLNDVYYHYCGVPESVWKDFKQAESFGRYFNQAIKEEYEYRDCNGPNY